MRLVKLLVIVGAVLLIGSSVALANGRQGQHARGRDHKPIAAKTCTPTPIAAKTTCTATPIAAKTCTPTPSATCDGVPDQDRDRDRTLDCDSSCDGSGICDGTGSGGGNGNGAGHGAR